MEVILERAPLLARALEEVHRSAAAEALDETVLLAAQWGGRAGVWVNPILLEHVFGNAGRERLDICPLQPLYVRHALPLRIHL